jgi:branched-chain amino acid transport system ATP-binding protein
MALLEVRSLSKNFGGLSALDHLDLDVHASEILGIIGPNGAGKSTLFNVVTGYLEPVGGKVIFDDCDITRMHPHDVAKVGIGRTFQLSTLFAKTTVFDCLFTAFHRLYQAPWWKVLLDMPAARKEDKTARQKVMEMLDFLELTEHKDKLTEELSSGFKRAVAIGIALVSSPKLLLLDEPVTTLSPDRVERIMNLLMKLRETGTTIVIIEHNMKAIMDYCDRIAVLAFGKNIAVGSAQQIRGNKEVIEAYLGEMD